MTKRIKTLRGVILLYLESDVLEDFPLQKGVFGN